MATKPKTKRSDPVILKERIEKLRDQLAKMGWHSPTKSQKQEAFQQAIAHLDEARAALDAEDILPKEAAQNVAPDDDGDSRFGEMEDADRYQG